MEFFGFVIAGFLISCIICAGTSAYLASEKGYDSAVWFFIGLFTWAVGIIAAAGLPDKRLRELLHRNAASGPTKVLSKESLPKVHDPDTWVCSKCFRINPNSEEECYKCDTKREV